MNVLDIAKFHWRITGALRSMSFIDMGLAIAAAVTLAAAKVWWYVSWIRIPDDGLTFCVDPNYVRIHFSMAIALVVCATSLCFRKATGFYVSVLSLAWVSLTYAAWYGRDYRDPSVEWAECLGHTHVFNVCGATYWDAAMFGLFLTLLVWHAKTIISALLIRRSI
ncbi:MAG: hypothetical protein H0V88_02560 [Pyrinomonadaceae bacterium]|nr:hypothetical protein [Pyrinomonadaceae bacterium]